MTLALCVLVGIPLLLWLVVQVARLGRCRRWGVWYPDHGTIGVAIYTGHWLGRLIPQAGVTFRRRVYLDHPGLSVPGGTVTTRDLLLHELGHIAQAERLGVWYVPVSLWHRVLGIVGRPNTMEAAADRFVDHYLAGHLVMTVPPDLLALYPTPSPRRAR